MCCTSPPYWALRSYLDAGHADKHREIGSEPTPGEFVQTMVAVFREVRRVLRDDGLLFLNLGDSYAGSWGIYGARTGTQRSQEHERLSREAYDEHTTRPATASVQGVPNGNKLGMPWRVAFALQADGWILRQDLVWHKKSPMPESLQGTSWRRCRVKVANAVNEGTHKVSALGVQPGRDAPGSTNRDVGSFNSGDGLAQWLPCPGCPRCLPHNGYVLRRGSGRCTTAHEFVFVFAKSGSYYWDMEQVREPCTPGTVARVASGAIQGQGRNGKTSGYRTDGRTGAWDAADSRIPRSVLTFSTEPFKGRHFATFPSSLPAFCIRAGSPPKCCAACKTPYAPVVESERVATRPGTDTKIVRDSYEHRPDIDPATNWQNSTLNYGNRDDKRHVAVTRVLGYRKTCSCATDEICPAVILDPFLGSGTTAWAAKWLGRDWIGCELSPEYAALAEKRINGRPPKWARKSTKKPLPELRGQRLLFTEAPQ